MWVACLINIMLQVNIILQKNESRYISIDEFAAALSKRKNEWLLFLQNYYLYLQNTV